MPAQVPHELDEYPVMVEVTTVHVVWVAAGDPDEAEAVRLVAAEPHDYIDDNDTAASWHSSTRAPHEVDWDLVRDPDIGSSYRGTLADAHVQTHRAWVNEQLRLMVETEDLAQDVGALTVAGRRTCRACRTWTGPEHAATEAHCRRLVGQATYWPVNRVRTALTTVNTRSL
jgi:hypothetical protein